MDLEKLKLLKIKIKVLKTFLVTVARAGRTLPDKVTADQYRRMYEDIKEMLDDPNLEIYAPNISNWYSVGGNGMLSQKQQVEIVSSANNLITYLEAVLASNSTESLITSESKIIPSNIFISHGKQSEASYFIN